MATTKETTNGVKAGDGISNHDEEKGLYRSTTGVTMSPELFEKVSFTRCSVLCD